MYIHTSSMYAAEKERKKNNERVPTRYLLGGGRTKKLISDRRAGEHLNLDGLS